MTKTLVLLASAALLSAVPAFAGVLECKLTDSKTGKFSAAKIDMSKADDVAFSDPEVNDLSFNSDSPACDADLKCTVNITVNSSKIEDEVGETTVAFDGSKDSAVAYTEPMNDGKKTYDFSCSYTK